MVDLVPRRLVEGNIAEPEFIPIDIPIGIINGFNGIATGHSTYSPPHSVYEVIKYIHDLCSGTAPKPLKPHFRGFKGEVEITELSKAPNFIMADSKDQDPEDEKKEQDDEYEQDYGDASKFDYVPPTKGKRTITTKGVFNVIKTYPSGKSDIQITELPISVWNDKYITWLGQLETEKVIQKFRDNSDDEIGNVNITIFGFSHPDGINHETLRLISKFGYNNITLIDSKGFPTLYSSVEEVIQIYFKNMISLYEALRLSKIKSFQEKIEELNWKREFIIRVNADEIKILKQKKAFVHQQMDLYKIPHLYYSKVRADEFSQESVLELTAEMESIKLEIDKYAKMLPNMMWSDRLVKLHNFLVKSGYTN